MIMGFEFLRKKVKKILFEAFLRCVESIFILSAYKRYLVTD